MKLLSGTLMTFLVLSSTLSANASTSQCGEKYARLFSIAKQNSTAAISFLDSFKLVAIGYDNAGYGPGPGRIRQQDFLNDLDNQTTARRRNLVMSRQELRELLVSNSECFPGMSDEAISTILRFL